MSPPFLATPGLGSRFENIKCYSFKCVVDGHWEYCKFTGPAPNYSECDFEWKRLANGVKKQVR